MGSEQANTAPRQYYFNQERSNDTINIGSIRVNCHLCLPPTANFRYFLKEFKLRNGAKGQGKTVLEVITLNRSLSGSLNARILRLFDLECLMVNPNVNLNIYASSRNDE